MNDQNIDGASAAPETLLNGGAGADASSDAPAAAAGVGAGTAPAATGGVPEWMMTSLSPANRAALGPKQFAAPDAMAEAYLNLEKVVGAKGVVLPGDDAQPEAWDKVYEQLGRPKDAAEYKFPMPEGVEAKESDKAFQGAMAPVLHKAGLNQKQVDVLAAGWNEVNVAAAANYDAELDRQFDAAETALKKEFGAAYDAKMAAGNLVVRTMGGDELADYLAESGLGRDPRYVKFLIKAGEAISGDGALVEGTAVAGISTPAAAKAEITRLENDKDFAKVFLDKSHPEYKAAVEKMQRLQALAHSTEAS